MSKTVSITPKPENQMIRAFKIFGEYKWRMVIIILIGIVGVVALSMMPTQLNTAIDRLEYSDVLPIPVGELSYIVIPLVIFIVLMLVNEVFNIICTFLILNFEAQSIQTLGLKVKNKLDIVPIAVLERYTVGDLTRTVAYNAPEMLKGSLVTLYQMSRAIFFYITTAVAMFTLAPNSWILALVVIASLPICVLTARFVSKRTQKYFVAQNELNGELSTYIDQRVSLQGFYRTHGLDENIAEFKQKNTAHASANAKEVTCTALNTMYITFIRNFMIVFIAVLSCILYNNLLLALAALPTFIMFSQRFLDQSVIVTNATNVLQVLGARVKRVFNILDQPEVTEHEHIKISKLQGDIKFEKVTLVENGERLIDNVSVTIPRGASVGIIGPTGGGKHKFVELLAKLAVPTEGKVTVGGTDLQEINSASYYDRISIAFEKPFIFKGTVAENILYGVGRAMPEKVIGTAKKLRSHAFIEQLPQGYETELNEKTKVLSTSQKQAITVARSVLEAPDLIITDGAMSFADNIIEREVIHEIIKMDKNQTKLFVTHRLGSIQNCDMIIFMEKGRIAEMGTHDQLMAKKKKYYKAFTGNA
jgi:ATP-binding cassette subfamily B protein